MGVSASTEHPEECWAFMKTLITENSSVMDGSTPLAQRGRGPGRKLPQRPRRLARKRLDLTADMGKITQRGLELYDA